MRRLIFLLLAFCSLGFMVAGPMGCGGDDPAGPDPDPGPDWPGGLALPVADEAALADVMDQLTTLRTGLGIEAARDSLLARIGEGWPGIADIQLASDGATFTLIFPDGVSALLFTDERDSGPWPPPEGVAPGQRTARSGPSVAPQIVKMSGCGDVVIPQSRKVHVVNLLGASNPRSHELTDNIEAFLMNLGWQANEIDISERESYQDRSITPDTVLQQEGYGIVLIMAHGGFKTTSAEDEHFVMETYRGDEWSSGYQDYVTRERYDEYIEWYSDGKLMDTSSWSQPDSCYKPNVGIRDDLLAEKMELDEGAMVAFVTCNSWQLEDELTDVGAGSVLGWDGSEFLNHGMDAMFALFEGLATQGGPGSDEATLAWMNDNDLGYSTGHYGEEVVLRLGGSEGTWYLPASMDFSSPDYCMPEDAEYYDVSVTFPDCPERNTSFQKFPGDDMSLTGLPPTGVEIEMRAKDASGNTIGASLGEYTIRPNGNIYTLCPCEGGLQLDLTEYPYSGMYAAASADIELSYGDPTLAGESYDLGLPLTNLDDLIPGPVTLDVAVLSEAGDVLGTTTVTEDVPCGEPRTVSFCIGWLTFTAGNYPLDTAEIVVAAPDVPSAIPASVSFAPGEEAAMYGFDTNGLTATIEAEAFNGLGVSLGTTSAQVDIGCGANEVALDFAVYGITVDAAPRRVTPDGMSVSVITATLRSFQEGDLVEPTGDPRPGVTVAFDSSLGFFVGATGGVTGDDGQVSVFLASNEEGMAAVRAFVEADGVESQPAYVNFGIHLSFQLNTSPNFYPDADPWNLFRVSCLDIDFYLNDESCFRMDWSGITSMTLGPVYYNCHVEAGDVMRFVFAPLEGYNCQGDPGFMDEDHHDLWLHYWYGNDYTHQGIMLLSDQPYNPMLEPVEFEVTFEEIPYYDGSKAPSRWR